MTTDVERPSGDGGGTRDAPHDGWQDAAWDRLVEAYRSHAPRGAAPPWLEESVMARIEALPRPGRLRRALAWLVRPREVRVAPLPALALAGLAALLLLSRDQAPPAPPPDSPSAVVYVEFVLEAPDARSVAVAGDFNGWRPDPVLQDPDGDGVWSGRVAITPGVHSYMFVIDSATWVTDPRAARYADDGFGNRNAVIAVTAPSL